MYSSVWSRPLTTRVSYASCSIARFSSSAIPWKNTGYCAFSNCSFHSFNSPPASSTSSKRSIARGGGILRPCSNDAIVEAE